MKGKAWKKVMFPQVYGKPTKSEKRSVRRRTFRNSLMILGRYRK